MAEKAAADPAIPAGCIHCQVFKEGYRCGGEGKDDGQSDQFARLRRRKAEALTACDAGHETSGVIALGGWEALLVHSGEPVVVGPRKAGSCDPDLGVSMHGGLDAASALGGPTTRATSSLYPTRRRSVGCSID